MKKEYFCALPTIQTVIKKEFRGTERACKKHHFEYEDAPGMPEIKW
jgi:hypothetical protein